MDSKIKFVLVIGILFFSLIPNSYQHGIGSETLPPVPLGNKQVALEVSSSNELNPENPNKEFSFSLFDTSNTITIRDVTYHIKAQKGNTFLFEDTFESKNGIFIMDLVETDSQEIVIEKEKQGSFFDTLIGAEKDVIVLKGAVFKTGGLYSFDVKITTAESFSNVLNPPIEYKVGISVPDRTFYKVNDPNFGTKEISVITYYDEIEDFQYDPATKAITFSMPFQWNTDNINQTSVVHEEITFSKTFGDLLVSEYDAFVNDVKVAKRVVTIDGFSEIQRIVHIVLTKNDLLEIFQAKKDNSEYMHFKLVPAKGAPLSTVTGNGQYRITLDSEPKEIKSGSEIKFIFDITDVFLKNRPVAVSYDLMLIHKENVVFSTSGISTDSKEKRNEAIVDIPEGVSGPVTVQFLNLGGNKLGNVGIPVVVDRIQVDEISIPDWVKNNAGWWSEGTIQDSDFLSGIEFMIKEGIIVVPPTQNQLGGDHGIPDWVKNNAGWWSEGLISDKEFASAIQFLIERGIVLV
ncbi:peptidase [Nitrosopumilus sp. b1]|uniref:peptidase n=1 Tax=Nitrosopumilus sp. b1 TaxID=2109907 RepID=UPI0015F725BE|nr:peptidase [Nitrosopumilus sp. b1]KAF6243557.1 peptidase [Nitrosopumilus sp. b1]